MKRTLLIGAIILAIAASAQHLFAAAITGSMQEPFDYAAATQFGTPNGGQGWNATGDTSANTAAWGVITGGAATARTATAPGLTYSATGYLAPTGNKLTLDGPSGSQNVGRPLGGQTINSGTTYFSFLIQKGTDTNRSMTWAFFNGTSGGTAGTTTSAERFAIGQTGATAGSSGGNISVIFQNSNPGGLFAGTTPMGLNTTHLIVGKIQWDVSGANDAFSMWVDPTDVTNEAAAGATYLTNSTFDLVQINHVRPFAGNSATGFPAVVAHFDEFRIGGSWEAVTSLPVPPPVPEPASALLVAMGGLARARSASARKRDQRDA